MFQNILKDFEDVQEEGKTKRSKFREIVKSENLWLYIIAFLSSMAGLGTELAPFGISILVATLSNNMSIGILCIAVGLGTAIGFGLSTLLQYILIMLVFFALVFAKKPKMQRNVNEKNKLGVHIFLSCIIVQAIQLLFKEKYVYDIIYSFMFAITTTMFYKIFVNAIPVIKQYKYKKVFSIEEVVGTTLLVAIAIAGIGDFAIFNFSVKNVLSILLVLILGWKNGILVGATGGVTVGIVLGIISMEGPIMVAAYAISGMIAGIFRKFGKIGVVIGFIIGTVTLTYVQNGNTIPVILMKEILIAFIGLLAVRKGNDIHIEDIYENSRCLPISGERELQGNSQTIYRLNSMSDTISEIAKSYKDSSISIINEEELLKQEENNKKIFIQELFGEVEKIKDNMLVEGLNDTGIINDIFTKLLQREQINRKNLIDIFEKNNSYLIGFEKENQESAIEKDIEEMVKTINTVYRLSKINFIWKKKLDENKRVVSNQLEEVSKAISTMASDISTQGSKEDSIKKEIKILLEQKQIKIREVLVDKTKGNKYTVTVYTEPCEDLNSNKCGVRIMQKIVEKVLNQKMVLQKQVCATRQKIDVCMFVFTTQDKYKLQIGVATATKKNSVVSGDSMVQMKLEDGKYLLALSDGMGSGEEAKKSSNLAIVMLQKLLSSGFEKETSIKLINSILSINTAEEMYATLDIGIVDLFEGTLEFIKNGACPTFIKNKNTVETLRSIALPAGIISDMDLAVYEKDLKSGDIIVMCSDGILESNKDYTNKELWVQYLLEEIQTDDAQKIADIVLSEAIDNDFGVGKDDMTVIVAKIM